jgi:signal transduction histidine kinase
MIELRTGLAPDLPDIHGADNEIRDALTNLIYNAVDAMPEGGMMQVCTSVLTSSTGSGTPAQHVRLEVRDTGIGMDEETRQRCLEPFFTTKGNRGTGLGLAMVYGMAQRLQRTGRSRDADATYAQHARGHFLSAADSSSFRRPLCPQHCAPVIG